MTTSYFNIITSNLPEFYNAFFNKLGFIPAIKGGYLRYSSSFDTDQGWIIRWSQPGRYEFFIGDYTVAGSFYIDFDIPDTYIHLGNFLLGKSDYKLIEEPLFDVAPQSFSLFASKRKGRQYWTEGQHFHSTDLIIGKDYLRKILQPECRKIMDIFSFLEENVVMSPLSPDILRCMQELCALFLLKVHPPAEKPSTDIAMRIKLPCGRELSYSPTDIASLTEAHNILLREMNTPPKLNDLVARVHLNRQKLTAGFRRYYHMSIAQFISSSRLALAKSMLLNTNEKIAVIARETGFLSASAFSDFFRKNGGMTPVEFCRHSKM